MPKSNSRRKKNKVAQACATMEYHRRVSHADAESRRTRRHLAIETREFAQKYQADGLRTGIVRIPVVVHIVLPDPNVVTDAQVHSQIEVLTADFRGTNSDASNVPAYFACAAADCRLEFALAVRGPNCEPVTGITRTVSGTTFTIDDGVKSSSTNGADPWPSDRYLNLWVCDLDGAAGYAAYPGGSDKLDGIVIDYRAFGTEGTAQPPRNLGRTATHEAGHWLDCRHIWGDDGGGCSGTDDCADTPNQAGPNSGSPTGIRVSCGNGPHGDMYMNFMDYTDDAARFMFTADQAARMNAALSTTRSSLLSSDGLIPVPASGPDLWMRNHASDNGDEPDLADPVLWASDDIWVRNSADGLENQDHQNPAGGKTNYVYVRVRHRGCNTSPLSGTLKLYWAKASTSVGWPSPWNGTSGSPQMGGVIGAQSVTVSGGSTYIAEFVWAPPDPLGFASFGADQVHFSLLARLETSPVAPFGMRIPETGSLYENVRNNNKIVWKNVSIADVDEDLMRCANVVSGCYGSESKRTRLLFETPVGPSVFDWGHLLVEFRGPAMKSWCDAKTEGAGAVMLPDGRVMITQPGACVTGPGFRRWTFGTLHVRFVPDGRRDHGVRVFPVDVIELDEKGGRVGGQRLILKTGRRFSRDCHCPGALKP